VRQAATVCGDGGLPSDVVRIGLIGDLQAGA
jgi:hypothetical protein